MTETPHHLTKNTENDYDPALATMADEGAGAAITSGGKDARDFTMPRELAVMADDGGPVRD